MYKHELLFKDYLELISKQSKECIIGFQEYIEPKKDISIKVNLQNGSSIIVYYNGDNIDYKAESNWSDILKFKIAK